MKIKILEVWGPLRAHTLQWPKAVLMLCKGCDGCCKCSCMGSMSVSSCRCCMFVSCVHHVQAFSSLAFILVKTQFLFAYKSVSVIICGIPSLMP